MRESIEAKNLLENADNQAEKMKTDYKDKLSEDDVKKIDEAVAEAKTHLEATDKDELEKAGKDLSDAIMPIGAKLYEAAQAEEKPAEGTDEKSDDKKKKADDVVEGEVVDDKDDKKED